MHSILKLETLMEMGEVGRAQLLLQSVPRQWSYTTIPNLKDPIIPSTKILSIYSTSGTVVLETKKSIDDESHEGKTLESTNEDLLDNKLQPDPEYTLLQYNQIETNDTPSYKRESCLVAQYLSSCYNLLKNRKTRSGITLEDVIQVAINCSSGIHDEISLVSGDSECLSIFREIYDPLIQSIQKPLLEKSMFFDLRDMIPYTTSKRSKYTEEKQLGKGEKLAWQYTRPNLKIDGDLIRYVHLSLVRNIDGYLLPSKLARTDRRSIESILVNAIGILVKEEVNREIRVNSSYVSMSTYMEQPSRKAELIELCHKYNVDLLSEPSILDSPLHHSRIACDWPDARGLCEIIPGKLLLVINHHDHIEWFGRINHYDDEKGNETNNSNEIWELVELILTYDEFLESTIKTFNCGKGYMKYKEESTDLPTNKSDTCSLLNAPNNEYMTSYIEDLGSGFHIDLGVCLKNDGRKLNSLLEGSKKRLFRLEKRKFNNDHIVNELVRGKKAPGQDNTGNGNEICQIRNVWTTGTLQQIIARFLEGVSIVIEANIKEDSSIMNANQESLKYKQDMKFSQVNTLIETGGKVAEANAF